MAPVYDLINCGPRHCFTVIDGNGDLLLVHNCFGFQLNPRLMKKGPFITWPYQDVALVGGEIEIGGEIREQYGLLECVVDQRDVRWPKSREGGASWLCLFLAVWMCMFHRDLKILIFSRDADAVDRYDDPDSLFEKMRFMLKYIPDWLKGDVKGKKMAFLFETGSQITGEANVSSAGVGGRATLLVIDEFGQYDKNGEEIYDFTSDTAHCRAFVFTHKDTAGMAYKLCYDSKFTNMREIMTHWSQHPDKKRGLYRWNEHTNKIEILDKEFDYTALEDFEFVKEMKPVGGPCPGLRSPWYDYECMRRNDRDVAMNLDIDPRGSSDRFFDSYRIHLLKIECLPPWTGTLTHAKDGRPISLDQDDNGLLKLWVQPMVTGDVREWLSVRRSIFPLMRCGAGVDVSTGSGYSPSCLSIGNARTGEKILEYSNANLFASDFATFVIAVLRLFMDERGTHPLLVWEIQGSAAFARRVQEELCYHPCWQRRDEDALGRPLTNSGKFGFNVNPKSIITLMDDYRDALYDRRLTNYSEEALKECLNFVYTHTGVEYKASGKRLEDGTGSRIHHGDVVRADALMYKMLKEIGSYEGRSQKQTQVEILDPRTFEGRVKLAEKQWREQADEVWV